MKKVEDYILSGENNDRMIQKALREVDEDCVINLCVNLGDKAELIYRNLSRRVFELVKKEVDNGGNNIPEARQKSSYILFQKKLLKYELKGDGGRVPPELSELKFNGSGEIRSSLHLLHELNREGRIAEMAELISKVADPLIRRQLETVLFAEDPLSGEMVIDRMAQREREVLARRQTLLKDGLLSLLSGDVDEVFLEKIYD